jgi:hypothetical protein
VSPIGAADLQRLAQFETGFDEEIRVLPIGHAEHKRLAPIEGILDHPRGIRSQQSAVEVLQQRRAAWSGFRSDPQRSRAGLLFHRAEPDDPFGSCFGHVDGAIAADRDIVNGVEHGIAGLAEPDGRDDIPVAVEL